MLENLKKILKSISESSVDFPHKEISHDVWEKEGDQHKLRKIVRIKIMEALEAYPEFNLISIAHEVRIVGSICGNLYEREADVDIHVVPNLHKLNKKLHITHEEFQKKVMEWYKDNRDINGWFAGTHPFEVYIQFDPQQDLMSEGVYNVLKDEWIKKPTNHDLSYDPYDVFKEVYFHLSDITDQTDIKLGHLRRDVMDYKRIRDAIREMPHEVKVRLKTRLVEKLRGIEKDILSLAEDKESWKELRKKFSQHHDEESAERDLHFSKNWEDANATFKFLDRYLYIKVISDLEKLIDGRDVDDSDIHKIENILRNYYSI